MPSWRTMVPAAALVEPRGATEFAHHGHQRFVEQAAEVQIFREGGERDVRDGKKLATGQLEVVAERVVPLAPLPLACRTQLTCTSRRPASTILRVRRTN